MARRTAPRRWKRERTWDVWVFLGSLVVLPVLFGLHFARVITLPIWLFAVLLLPFMGAVLMWGLLGWTLLTSLGSGGQVAPVRRLPEGVREFTRFQSRPIPLDEWHGRPPLPHRKPVVHRLDGHTAAGRRWVLLGTADSSFTYWWLLLELDGWLPPLELSWDLTPGDRDRVIVEDVEFNRIWDVRPWEHSPVAVRYAHAMLHPRMLEHLLADEPLPWRVAGEWLVTQVDGNNDAREVLGTELPKVLARLEPIAQLVPSHVYRDLAHLRGSLGDGTDQQQG